MTPHKTSLSIKGSARYAIIVRAVHMRVHDYAAVCMGRARASRFGSKRMWFCRRASVPRGRNKPKFKGVCAALRAALPAAEIVESHACAAIPSRKRFTPLQKRKVGALAKWRFEFCSQVFEESFAIDHILPVARGGSDAFLNRWTFYKRYHGKVNMAAYIR